MDGPDTQTTQNTRYTQLQGVLTRLEAKLAQLQASGVACLNIATAPALAEELRATFAAAAGGAVAAGDGAAGGTVAGAAVGTVAGKGAVAAGRAANVAASLKGAPPPAPPGVATPPRADTEPRAETAPPSPTAQPTETAPPSPTAPPAETEPPAGDAAAGVEQAAPLPPGEIHTLESLFFQYRNCMACGLGNSRNRLVFGAGDGRARLLFIGEGPGAEEDQQGIPFVGRAGMLLTGFIQALGLTRDDVYITNVIKCRPPGNRNPEAGEAAACRPILMRQIELIDPALIVTLGNVPLKALNPNAAGITRERGRPFAFGQWQVLPTFHPSYLLRSPAGLQDCWSDFRQALKLAYPSGAG